MASETDKQVAKQTFRRGGAVGGEHAIVPQVVREFLMPQHKVLDYGAGMIPEQAQQLKSEGYNVTAHDYHAENPEVAAMGLHDPEALKRRYDLVYASNVLNVQNSPKALAQSLKDIAGAVGPQGMAIVNFPLSPRKDAFRGMTNEQAVASVEASLKRRFRKVERHPRGTKASPIWILKEPRV